MKCPGSVQEEEDETFHRLEGDRRISSTVDDLSPRGDGERQPRGGRDVAERQPRGSREAAERQPRGSRETAGRQPGGSRETAEVQPRGSREAAEVQPRCSRGAAEVQPRCAGHSYEARPRLANGPLQHCPRCELLFRLGEPRPPRSYLPRDHISLASRRQGGRAAPSSPRQQQPALLGPPARAAGLLWPGPAPLGPSRAGGGAAVHLPSLN